MNLQNLQPSDYLVFDVETIPYLGVCVECRFRAPGRAHHHIPLALTLRGYEHRCWFDVAVVALLRATKGCEIDFKKYPLTSWTYEQRDGGEYLRLSIEVDKHNPKPITHVWKLTDERRIDRILGVWPD